MMFNQYPYINVNDLNLDYILSQIKIMMNEVTNFVSINAIKYADPIQWDITRQYEKNTVVIDPVTGTAYISVAPVPAGVALTRPEYWTVVFDLGSFVTRAAQNFTSHYEESTTLTATFPTSTGGWLVWGDVLYKALTNITAGDSYVVGGNIEHFTVEDLYNDYLNTIAAILAVIGNLQDLTTSDTSDIVHAINSVLADLNLTIGDLADLTTSDTSNIVNAINAALSDANSYTDTKVGNLNNLPTSDKTNIVASITEIDNNINDIRLHAQFVTPQLYGAVGDGVNDDTAAIQSFFDACLQGEVGFIPQGTYLVTTQIILDFANANVRQLYTFGAGCYRSTIYSTYNDASNPAFLIKNSNGTAGQMVDNFHVIFDSFGISGDTANVTFQIGQDNYYDSFGNFNLRNMFFANRNSGNNASCAAAKYNYLFDCLFENCVYVNSAKGLGYALILRLCRFCSFIGGSYSNANTAIWFPPSTYSDTLTFVGADFENLEYGIYAEGHNAYIKFITCYFDIWRPDLTPPQSGTAAIYSTSDSAGGITIENALFARSGYFPLIDQTHIDNVRCIGVYSYPAPAVPASGVGLKNSFGMDCVVYAYVINSDNTSHIDWCNIENDVFSGRTVATQCGDGGVTYLTQIVPAGATIKIGYTGTIYWFWSPISL